MPVSKEELDNYLKTLGADEKKELGKLLGEDGVTSREVKPEVTSQPYLKLAQFSFATPRGHGKTVGLA